MIKVKKITGLILSITSLKDEIVSTKQMLNKIIARLEKYKFMYHSGHILVEGGNTKPLKQLILYLRISGKCLIR